MNTIVANYFGFNKILSVFPELYNYKEYAPLLLRVSLGFVFISDGWQDFRKIKGANFFIKVMGVIKIVVGSTLLLGLYTQPSAMVGGIISLINAAIGVRDGESKRVRFHLIILVILISLLLSGPGLYSFDLPL